MAKKDALYYGASINGGKELCLETRGSVERQ
jgi:hypothetical protein